MAGLITQGTTFEISADNVTYNSLGCIQSFSITKPAKTEIDTTCLSSTSKEFKLGLKENGTISVELLYAPGSAGDTDIEGSYNSDVAYFFKVTYNDQITPATGNPTEKSFEGYVTSISQDAGIDEVVRQTVEIKINSDITVIPAT